MSSISMPTLPSPSTSHSSTSSYLAPNVLIAQAILSPSTVHADSFALMDTLPLEKMCVLIVARVITGMGLLV